MRLFERNIFVIETFALSPLIPELYWFSWESLWSVFWLWSMVLLAYLSGRLVDVSRFSSLYKRCVFSRETFLSLKLSLYLPSSLSYIDSREKALECFWLWSMVLLAYLSGRLVDVSRFSSLYKRCVFSRETFLSLKLSLYLPSSLSYIDSREKALGVLWSMVLLAYLSDDSLMWADFQYQTRVELFERTIFVIETFALSPLIPELLILVRKPLECFWFWSMVLLAYLLDDS